MLQLMPLADTFSIEMIHLKKMGRCECATLLYARYSASLFGMVMKRVENPERAEEILENVFGIALNNIRDFNGGYFGIFTWLMGIVGNECERHGFSEVHSRPGCPDKATPLLDQLVGSGKKICTLPETAQFTRQEVGKLLREELGKFRTFI
ncbi:MAG: sigma-70 family RNA polymerase sigma factor [Pedobacter sp.]|nr:MAG: sigma-70 family RNA polymerase sigma factor [Pedobacter sp.]